MEGLPNDLENIPQFVPLVSSESSDDDWEIDQILSQIPDPANVCPNIPYIPGPQQASHTCGSQPSTSRKTSERFAKPVSDEELQSLRKSAIPANTQKSTNWAVNVWKEWSEYRRKENPSDWPAHLLIMSDWEFNRWLSRFVVEIFEVIWQSFHCRGH